MTPALGMMHRQGAGSEWHLAMSENCWDGFSSSGCVRDFLELSARLISSGCGCRKPAGALRNARQERVQSIRARGHLGQPWKNIYDHRFGGHGAGAFGDSLIIASFTRRF